jgi:HEAT repeat protein
VSISTALDALRIGRNRAPEGESETASHEPRSTTRGIHQASADPDPSERETATLALGELAEQSSVTTLVARLDDDPDADIRQAAAIALGRIGDPSAAPALRRALHSDDANLRFQIPAALAACAPESAGSDLATLLDDGDWEVRASAAAALGDLGHGAASDLLAARLADPEIEVRLESAVALTRLGDHRGHGTLLAFLDHRDHRRTAARHLYEHPPPRARDALRQQLRRPRRDPLTRTWIAGALAKLDHSAGQEQLERSLRSRRPMVRGLAIEILGALEQDWARDALVAFAKTRAAKRWQAELRAALEGGR